MDLIDRSKLEAFGATCKSQDYMDGVKDTLEYIDNLPTVDAIPIEWIEEYIFSLNFGLEDEPIHKRIIVKFTIEILDHLMSRFKEEQEKENENS